MDKISVVLATYNEEKNLADCLNSVKNLAWEIVVVDGESKDATVEIAKRFNAKVLVTVNPPIFHINKNKAIEAAKGDWVLQLDADERVTKELAKEVKQAIIRDHDINGYWIPRKNFFLGRFLEKGGQYPDYTLRLYRKGKGKLPAKDVHEQAVVEGKTGHLQNPLLHLRDKNFSEYIFRLNRYTDLMALQLRQNHLTPNFANFVNYIFLKPVYWFILAYFRHRGYIDKFPGFVFALFSALRFPISYIKFLDNETSL